MQMFHIVEPCVAFILIYFDLLLVLNKPLRPPYLYMKKENLDKNAKKLQRAPASLTVIYRFHLVRKCFKYL